MTKGKQKPLWKTVSALTVLIFSFQQILSAAPPEWQSNGAGYQSVKSISNSSEGTGYQDLKVPGTLQDGSFQESQDFLEQTLTLIPVDDEAAVKGNDHYEYERYSFEDAIEQFRPEYATAVIVEDLTEENLKALTGLEFEVGIAVVEGEIVLFSSGNKDEIMVNAPARGILEKASFIAHTHPHGENAGPSRFDLEYAGERTEYVITEEQIYGYSNKDGEIRQAELSHREFLSVIEKAADEKTVRGNVEARSILNAFIREMDAVNALSETEKIKFRSDENITLNAADMIKPSSGWWQPAEGGYVMLWSGVALEKDIQVTEAGVYEIEIIANANDVTGVLPELQLKMDGDIAGNSLAISNNNWNAKSYNGGTVDLTSGQHRLAIQYTNDSSERDVFIHRIILRKVAELPSARFEIEADAMIKPSTGWWQPAEGGYVMLWSSVALESDIQVAEAGVYEMEIIANANDVTGVLPELQMKVDGDIAGDNVAVSHNNWNPKRYSAGIVDLTAGQHRLALQYTNDNHQRDVFIYQIRLRKIAELPAVRLELEATAMTKPSTGWWQPAEGGYVMLWSGIALESNLQIPSDGVYEMEIIANANAVTGVLPEVQMKVNGRVAGNSVAVSNNYWSPKRYSAGTIDLTAGQHQLALQFINDTSERDIFVYQIRLRKVAELPARVSVDAVSMVKPSWGWWQPEAGGFVMLWGGVGLESNIQLEEDGLYEVEVIANANVVTGVQPELAVKVDGRLASGLVSVTNNNWNPKIYNTGRVELKAGQHKLDVKFTNDTNERDVFIYEVRLRKIGEISVRVEIEAELMTLPAAGTWVPPAGNFVTLWAGGSLNTDIEIEESGEYEIEVWGSGSVISGELPQVGVKIDGQNAGQTVSLGNNSWSIKGYSTGTVQLEAGAHALGVSFLNDSAERDATIDRVVLRKVRELPPVQVEFLSSATHVSDSLYTLRYRIAGQEYSETWRLHDDVNHLMVTHIPGTDIPVHGTFTVTGRFTIAAVLPQMPHIPAIPEDLVSVTTETGHILKYSQGALFSVEKTGEYELFLPVYDEEENLTGGILRYQSGDLVLIRNSKPFSGVSAAGEQMAFNEDGNVKWFYAPEEKIASFAYRYNAEGEITSILSDESGVSSLYQNGLPAWILMGNGTDIRYRDGFISEYRDSSGNRFNYTTQTIKTGEQVAGYRSKLASVIPAGSSEPVLISDVLREPLAYQGIASTLREKLSLAIEYDAQKKMKRFTSGKNEILDLQNGLPTALTTGNGQTIEIDAVTGSGADLNALSFTQNNLGQTYNDAGQLTGITLGDGTTLGVENQQLAEITLSDGSRLNGLKWNGDILVDFIRTRADGGKETYQNQELKRKEDPNGTVTTYIRADGVDHPDLMTTADGRTYHFIEYENAQGLAERISELVSMDLEDGSRIEFERGKPVRYIQTKQVQRSPMVIPDLPAGQFHIPSVTLEHAQLLGVTIDANGQILSGQILFNDGTQYFIEDDKLKMQVAADGRVIEISNQPLPPVQTFPAVPAQPLNAEELAYKNELINNQLDFFIDSVGIDPITGFPMDNYDSLAGVQSDYSQATLVGMWAEILSAIALGHYVTPKMTKLQAFQKLEHVILNLIDVQEQAGWNGMFSFFGVEHEEIPVLDEEGNPTGETETVTSYRRQFDNIGIGDNLNLSVSLSSVIGAINLSNDPATNALRDRIVGASHHILWKQSFGYDEFYDAGTKRFRMAKVFNEDGTEEFAGYMDRVFNEFRTGMFWLGAQNPRYREAVENLDVTIRPYETSGGQMIDNTVPFDGGAFQMFWPLMHVDETQYPEFDAALKNFLYSQADFVKQNGIPGLLSAGSVPGMTYQGKVGVPGAAETDDPLITEAGSIYGTASAFLLAPHYTLQLLKNLETSFPGIRSSLGYTDSVKFQDVTHIDPITGEETVTREPVFADQYYGVDQASFMLSLMGTSRSYFNNFMNWQGLAGEFDDIYRSMAFGIAPAALSNPEAPDFNPAGTPKLFTGANPDGSSHALVRQPAFVDSVIDPEFGEGKIYNYLTPNGKFHHIEIEFENRTYNLQEYILLPGRGDSARTLTEGMRFDLLNEGIGHGAFYTPGQGYANNALTVDAALGEVHRLNFDFRQISKPVGLWTKYDNLDLGQYDYLSIPVKLGEDTPEGIRLKIELKGMGQIYVSPTVTSDWQFIQIPVAKPAGLLTEIAVSIQTLDGDPLAGQILMGPLSSVKVRTSNNIDWMFALGKTATELRNLLKQKAAEEPALGGGMIEAQEILENFTLDHDGKLVNGTLRLADGGIQYYQKGFLTRWIFPNGRTVLFAKGLATFAIDLAHGELEIARFYYDQSFNGQIRSFILQDNDRKRIYGGDGKLQTMIEAGHTVQFENGEMFSITTPQGVLTNLEFAGDGSLLKAHVRLNDGTEFEIDQTVAVQMVVRPDGTKIYYQGDRISAIETPENGRTDFEYQHNAIAQLLGVNAVFNETPSDPLTRRTLSLAEYLRRPERAIEKSEILEDSRAIVPISNVGGFSLGYIFNPEKTYAERADRLVNDPYDLTVRSLYQGLLPGDQMGFLFQYQNLTGPIEGAYLSHPAGINVSNYDFVTITLRQAPDMNWSQDFNLRLKTFGNQDLYTFQVANTQTVQQTFSFSLAGKSGVDTEITLEAVREEGGLGKLGRVYIQDLSYFSIKRPDSALWQDSLAITPNELRSIRNESNDLISVGAEVASGNPLVFSNLAAHMDLPSWMIYSDQSENETGKLVSFKRFDGSEVFVDENQSVTRVILSDGTVNDYAPAPSGSGAQNVITGPGETGNNTGTADYRYGQIRSVTQTGNRQYTFTYEYDNEGEQITIMRDSTSGEERRFKNGQLIQSGNSGLQTNYSYAEGELAAANMVYKNRVLESTSYYYAADETLITDERGTTWYYNVDGILVKHLTKDGYLYQYSDYTFEQEEGPALPAGDYKNAIFSATNLRSVIFTGYEAADGSQLILDSTAPGGDGELKFMNGDHGVNLELDGDRRIKSGQIQFKDGLIVEIENYVPVRGRLANGDFFSLAMPLGESYELLQDAGGAYLGTRVKSGLKLFTYDAQGRLTRVETETGEKDLFTYTLNASGVPVSYQRTREVQLAFSGVPFPKEVRLEGGSTQKIFDGEVEVIAHEGNGFVLSVFKEDINQWDSLSGTFTSAADRFKLEQTLREVRAGQAVSMMVSDPAFNQAGENILALLEGFGAGRAREAAGSGQSWGFFGNESLQTGQAAEHVGGTSFSTLTKTVSTDPISPNTTPLFSNQPLMMMMPPSVSQAYDRFLKNYEPIKPSPDTYLVTVYDSNENIVYTQRIDGVYAYYEKGKVRETFNPQGELLSVHEYVCAAVCATGADMELSRIRLVKARADFETEAAELEQKIEQAKVDALFRLAWQSEAARLQIQEEVDVAMAAISNQISSLESQRFQQVKQCSKGFFGFGKKCKTFTVEVPGVAEAISSLHTERSNILRAQQTELANLPGEIAERQTEIEEATEARMEELAAKKAEIHDDILRQEIEPILMDYYRRLMGRDPSTEEMDDWLDRSRTAEAVDIQALKNELLTSPERAARINQKLDMITGVKSFLEEYLAASLEQKTQMLTSLQLSSSEVMNLERADLDGVFAYLDSRSLHFGQSAFGALQKMLLSKGQNISMEDLGTKTLLIDILTGVLNRYADGELVLSMFALARTAKIYGQDFSSVKYSLADLISFYAAACPPEQEACSLRMIAHVSEDHFVTVTRVTAKDVTLFESSKGANGEEKTVSRANFMEVWNVGGTSSEGGYLLVDQPQLIEAKKITDAQAQKIRGAFWPFFFFIAAIVLSALSYVVSYFSPTLGKILGYAAMVAGIAGIVASVGNVVVSGLKAAYGAIQNQGFLSVVRAGLSSVGKFVMQSVQHIGRFVLKGFNFLKDGFSSGFAKLGAGIAKIKDFVAAPGNIIGGAQAEYTFAQQAGKFLIAAGVSHSITKGLEGFGLSPTLLRLVGAFVSAGVMGVGGAASNFLKSGLQGLLMQGVSEMGLKLNLPPPVSSALSLLAGNSLKAWFDPTLTLKQSLSQIAPQVTKQLTLGGTELLGRSLGWNPRITNLLGYPLAGFAGSLASNLFNPNYNNADGIFGLIRDALFSRQTLSGLVSVGAEFVLDSVDLDDSLAGALFTRLSVGLIKDFIQTKGKLDIFDSLVNSGQQSLNHFFDPILMPQLFAAVAEQGLAAGFEQYATSILRQDTIEDFAEGGVSFAEQISVALLSPESKDCGGKLCKAIHISKNGKLITFEYFYENGKFEIYGIQEISDGTDRRFVFKTDANGNIVGVKAIVRNEQGRIVTDRDLLTNGYDSVQFTDFDGNVYAEISLSSAGKLEFVNYNLGIRGNVSNNGSISFSYNIPELESDFGDLLQQFNASNLTAQQKQDVVFFSVGNGFWNNLASKDEVAGLSQDFIQDLTGDLGRIGLPPAILYENGRVATDRGGNILTTASLPITLYEDTGLIGNGLRWACETWFGCNGMKEEIIDEVTHYMNVLRINGFDPSQMNMVHFAHSGNFQPMIKALEDPRLSGLNLETMIVFEGPYVGDSVIQNTNLDTIIRIHGTDGVFAGDVPVPFLEDKQFKGVYADGSIRDITNYNIEILGAKHSDFDSGNNHKVNLFMRDLNLKAADSDPNRLQDFLSSATLGVTEDPVTHVITVDLTKYISPYGERI